MPSNQTPKLPDIILSVDRLEVEFTSRRGATTVLDGVSFDVRRGETLCIVGESGCGKSMTALALMRLLPAAGHTRRGTIRFGDRDLLTLPESDMRNVRGNRVSMIFQEPMTALNPVLSVGRQIDESLMRHKRLSRKEASTQTIGLLRAVGIPAPERRRDNYAHQLSGGMRQRVMIAMALACEPDVLIADEPTTALDVTVQAQIFDLLRDLQARHGTALVMITHDMGTVSEMADRVIVMYAGKIVESGTTDEVLRQPSHPYTQGLIACLPELGASQREIGNRHDGRDGRGDLPEIPGVVPPLWALGQGCAFRDRCAKVHARCDTAPSMFAVGCNEARSDRHAAACWLLAPLND